MAKKTPLKITFDSVTPVVSILVFASLVVCLTKAILHIDSIDKIFSAPSAQGTPCAFNPKSVLDYFRLLLHIFGTVDVPTLCANILILVFVAPQIEERLGSLFTAIMVLVSALVTGVVNACFMREPTAGFACLLWLFFLLTAFPAENRKNLSVVSLFALVILAVKDINLIVKAHKLSYIAEIAGGFCGSLISFAVSTPKSKSTKKSNKKVSEHLD